MGAVSQWLPLINEEIIRGGYPFPPELITSVIRYESHGKAGLVNKKSGASGLMQVMPGTLEYYNKRTGDNIRLSALRSQTQNAARAQIRSGLWVLGQYWRSAAKWLRTLNGQAYQIPIGDLARFGSAFYVAGPGKIKKRAPQVRPMSWAAWERKHPRSNSTNYCNRIWKKTSEKNPTWNMPAIEAWTRSKPTIQPPPPPPLIADRDPAQGLLIGLMVILFGMWILKSQTKSESKASVVG